MITLKTRHKIQLAALAYHSVQCIKKAFGSSMKGQFRRNGFLWDLDLNEVVDFMIYLTGSFEPTLNTFLKKHIRKGQTVVDIGANMGAHSLTMGRCVGPDARVFAIEATQYAHEKLTKNISNNPEFSSCITALHCLLENDESRTLEEICSSWPFDSSAKRHPLHQGTYKSVGSAKRISFDKLAQSLNIQKLDLIKIDVDGNEWSVLSRARDSLRRFQPIIVMELAPDYSEGDEKENFFKIHELFMAPRIRFSRPKWKLPLN